MLSQLGCGDPHASPTRLLAGLTPAERTDWTNDTLTSVGDEEAIRTSERQDRSGLQIGPVAHDLLLANDDIKIWRVR
jgi:hypothetical protein